MTDELIFYAHVDPDGRIVGHGHAHGLDAFVQLVPEGVTCVVRPPHVISTQPWRLVDGVWILEEQL